MNPGHFLWTFLFMNSLWLLPTDGAIRDYYLAIENVTWDYAPKGRNVITNQPLNSDTVASSFLKSGKDRIGSSYKKTVYKEYSDGTYTVEVAKPAWLGFLGPLLQAEVGDVMRIHLKNFASRPFTIHPHGVFYEKDSEGSLYPDGSSGSLKADDSVPPGGYHVYNWTIPEGHAPTDADPACLTWIYHSHVDAPRDIATGLIGPLITCKRGTYPENQPRKDVDHNFFLLFSVIDENLSWYLDDNIAAYCSDPTLVDKEDEDFQESNRMHAINGFVFGNLPELNMCAQKHVAWHLFGMGNEIDVHTAFFHGQLLTIRGHRTDVAHIFPATFVTAEMVPQKSGTFEIYCQAGSHREAGMRAVYNVSQCSSRQDSPRKHYQASRVYYIMAEEVEWDYCPDRSWELEWHNTSEEDSGHVFLSNKDGLLGSRYKKAVFREYTDGTFRIPQPRSGPEEHLGILGPLIRGEVGDILTVVFKNNASRPYSVHAHGVLESNTGWPQAAEPGEVLTYQWNIPERSGPGPGDSACVSWIYYSAVEPIKDMYSGLVGPLVICRKGVLGPYGGRNDMDREFALLFLIFDENQSWYLEENIAIYGSQETKHVDLQNETFVESNKMHAINGKLYANLKGLTVYQGQDTDIHTVHFHAESFLYQNGHSYRADVVDLFPGTFEVVEMVASNPGTWLMHCHVTDHVHAGMETIFTVLSRGEHLSTMTTVTKEIGKVILRNIGEDNMKLLGIKIPIKNAEILSSVLIATSVFLLVVALALGVVVWYQHRQRKLRRNRRSILDDSFKLLSLKQ
ncbi:Heph [Lemmus lemmus]